jgi:hypothetical protein
MDGLILRKTKIETIKQQHKKGLRNFFEKQKINYS